MARALSLVVGGLLVAAGIAFLAPALSGHASARAAWEAERARLGTAAYDAARIDARYLESRRHHARAGHAALLLAAGLLVLGAVRPAKPEREGPPASTARRARASLVDLLLVAALLGPLALDTGESAALHALSRAAPPFALGTFALPAARGQTLGLRLAGLRLRRAPWPRVLLATLALPLAALALLALPTARRDRAPRLAAPHLALAGLHPVALRPGTG